VSDPRWPVDPFEVSNVAKPRVRGPRSSTPAQVLPAEVLTAEVLAGDTPIGDVLVQTAAPPDRPEEHGRGGLRSELATLARGGTLTLAGSVASSLLGFALVVVIARGFRQARVAGVLFEVIALFMIISNTTELGADTGLVRMVAGYRATGRSRDVRPTLSLALWPVLLLSSAVAILVYAFAPQLATVFIHGGSRVTAVRYIRVFAPFLPMASATTVILSGTRGFGTMVPYVAVLNVGVPLLRPLLIVIAVTAGLGASAVALSWALPVAAGFVVALVWAYALLRRTERRELRTSEPRRSRRALAGEFWRFSSARGIAGFLQITVIWLSPLIVGALATTREAGIFAAVNRFVGVGTFALQAVGIALAPQIASLLARNDRRRAEAIFQTGTWWLMALGWPLYITMAVFGPFLLRIFGREYVAGQDVLLILALGMLALVGTGNNKIVLLMGGGSGWNLAISSASLILNIGLNLLLVPTRGMNGAAIALAATVVFDMGATTLVVWKRLHLQPFGSGYPVVALGSVLCYGGLGLAVRVFAGMSFVTFAGFAVAATGVYLLMLWRFRHVLRLSVLRSSLRMRNIMSSGSMARAR
jgi:O-antigen/teichoic acid export membrane protein